jgi:hypothetical protein
MTGVLVGECSMIMTTKFNKPIVIDWAELASKYWRPSPEKEYIVEFGDWHIGESNFGNADLPPRKVLVLNVYTVQANDEDHEEYTPPKEFSTYNWSFIEGIRPIIDKAVKEGRDRVYVQLKRNTKGTYSLFTYNVRMGKA